MQQSIAKEQTEVRSVIRGQFLLLVGKGKDTIGKIGLTVVADGIDHPNLNGYGILPGLRVFDCNLTVLLRAGIGVELFFVLPQDGSQVIQ